MNKSFSYLINDDAYHIGGFNSSSYFDTINVVGDPCEVTLEKYLDSLILTDTPHKKDSPFLLELIEQILQVTVIVPMIEKALDKTLIIGDYLTDDEGGLRAFASTMNAVLLGSGALSGNALKLIGTELLAEITINSAMICAEKNGSIAEGTLLLLFVVGALTPFSGTILKVLGILKE